MIRLRTHFTFAALLVVICFLSSYSGAAVQNASPSPTPPPPPPTNIPSVPTGNAPAAPPKASPQPGSGGAAQPGGSNQPQNAAEPVDPTKLQQAKQSLQKTPPPKPQPTPQPPSDSYILDWTNGSTTPDTVYNSGRRTLRITNINDIIYSYSVKVTPVVQSTDDLSQWSDLIQSTIKALTSQANKTGPNLGGTCNLASVLGSETQLLNTIKSKLDGMEPKASGNTKCSSIPVNRTISDWKALRSQYDDFESGLADVQNQISNPDCASDPQLDSAVKLIVDQVPALQQQVITIQKKVDLPHFQDVSYDLKRTSDYDISVVEACLFTS